jgi:hypothetical protein
MGIRQPTRTGTFFAQAKAGAEQQKEARETLKKPQALGGAASAGTQMVANTTGAQQQATQEVEKKGQELQTTVDANKITTPTATAGAFTAGTPSEVTTAETTKSTADTYGDAGYRNTGTNTLKVLGRTINIPVFSVQDDTTALNKNKTEIETNLNTINNLVKEHDAGVSPLAAADIKALTDAKNAMMSEWQKFDDAITKENLGKIAGPSTFETNMATRESLLASEGQNVGKLASIFGPRWNAQRYGGLASQIYGKDLEAIQEEAGEALSESDRAKRAATQEEKEFKTLLDTTKKGVNEKVKQETEKIDALKNGWDTLKSQGETLTSLSKLFGSDAEAKKYFTFNEKGELTGDKRSEARAKLSSTADALKTELGKTTEKIKKQEEQGFDLFRNELLQKDAYGNVTGGTLKQTKDTISSNLDRVKNSGITPNNEQIQGIANKFLNNIASVEAEINNAIVAKDTKRVKAARDQLNTLNAEYRKEIKNFGEPAPMTQDFKTKQQVPNFNMMKPGQIYKLPDGRKVAKPFSTRAGVTFPVEVDDFGIPTGKRI